MSKLKCSTSKRLTIFLTIIMIALLATLSCAAPKVTPAQITEPEITTDFNTYTHEGLFSISYPPDWEPAISMMEEYWEFVQEEAEALDPDLFLEGCDMVFLGGKPQYDVYDPCIDIRVMPRSTDYWTLDEINETESQWAKGNLPQYREFSTTKTIIDGREALICDYEYYSTLDACTLQLLQAITVKDEYVWFVNCRTEPTNFEDYRDTFNSVIRSLRILK